MDAQGHLSKAGPKSEDETADENRSWDVSVTN